MTVYVFLYCRIRLKLIHQRCHYSCLPIYLVFIDSGNVYFTGVHTNTVLLF